MYNLTLSLQKQQISRLQEIPRTMDGKIAHACAGAGKIFNQINTLSAAMTRLAAPVLTLNHWIIISSVTLILHQTIPFSLSLVGISISVVLLIRYQSEACIKRKLQAIINKATLAANSQHIAAEWAEKAIASLTQRKKQLGLLKAPNPHVRQDPSTEFDLHRGKIWLEGTLAQTKASNIPSLLDQQIATDSNPCKNEQISPLANLADAMERLAMPSLRLRHWAAIGSTITALIVIGNIPLEMTLIGLGALIFLCNRAEAKVKLEIVKVVNASHDEKERHSPSPALTPLIDQLNLLEHTITAFYSSQKELA